MFDVRNQMNKEDIHIYHIQIKVSDMLEKIHIQILFHSINNNVKCKNINRKVSIQSNLLYFKQNQEIEYTTLIIISFA